MPLHDWKRVENWVFHEVHTGWLVYLRDALNAGRLPAGYHAHAEQRAEAYGPDVIALDTAPDEPRPPGGSTVAVVEPQTTRRLVLAPDTRPRRVLTVRHTGGERVVAVVELVSRRNKDRPESVREFAGKVADLLRRRVNATLVDVHRPGRHDRGGMAAAVCRVLRAERPADPPRRRPYTFAAFRAAPPPPELFQDDFAVGDPLPSTPLFLDGGVFVPLPLEETYRQAVAALDPKSRAALTAHPPPEG